MTKQSMSLFYKGEARIKDPEQMVMSSEQMVVSEFGDPPPQPFES